jgi:hypothetical protein
LTTWDTQYFVTCLSGAFGLSDFRSHRKATFLLFLVPLRRFYLASAGAVLELIFAFCWSIVLFGVFRTVDLGQQYDTVPNFGGIFSFNSTIHSGVSYSA